MMSAIFKPKRTAAASRGFLATARLSCLAWYSFKVIDNQLWEKSDPLTEKNKISLRKDSTAQSWIHVPASFAKIDR